MHRRAVGAPPSNVGVAGNAPARLAFGEGCIPWPFMGVEGAGQWLPFYAAAAAVGLEAACCLAPMAWTAVPVEVAWGGAGRGEVKEQVGRAVAAPGAHQATTQLCNLECSQPTARASYRHATAQGLISSHPKQQRRWWKQCVSHATVLTMSATVQPRDRSFTGLARPCAEGEGLCSRT